MSFAFEDRLMVVCSRVNVTDKAARTAEGLLQGSLDWDYILKALIIHGIAPLFYHGLSQVLRACAGDLLVPTDVMSRLTQLYQGNLARNRRLYRTAVDIFGAFERAGVSAMGLKDFQLTRSVYPDIGLRPMGDMDILIHRQDYKQAAACLAALGFIPLPDSDIPFTIKYAWAHNFQRPVDNTWIDVQWDVFPVEGDIYHESSFLYDVDRMWSGATFVEIDGCSMLTPRPEDMLFHLCLHLEGHHYAELILFCDIVELLSFYRHQFDWRYLIDMVHKYKAESCVYYVLLMTQRLFHVSLPSFLLQEIEPLYFQASLSGPIFDNITPLHLSLDEIRLAAKPSQVVLAEFEVVVREQTVSTMQLYREIDHVVSTFVRAGGGVIIIEGASSQRIFPDRLLRPFEGVKCLILAHDLDHMRQALLACGFVAEQVDPGETYAKDCPVVSKDPLLVDRSIKLVLHGSVQFGLDSLLQADQAPVSRKAIALDLIKDKLFGHRYDEASVSAQLKITVLSPEDMFVYLGDQLGRNSSSRLFAMVNFFEFFRGYSAPLDWQQVFHQIQQHQISSSVGEGVLLIRDLLDERSWPPNIMALASESNLQPRVLEWARYGPHSLDLYTHFKNAFFFFYSFLSIRGIKARVQYLIRSLIGFGKEKPVLPGLMFQVAQGILALLQKKSDSITDFAYWIEPETDAKTKPKISAEKRSEN